MNSDEYANEIAMRERRAQDYLVAKWAEHAKAEHKAKVVVSFVSLAVGLIATLVMSK